MSVRTSRSIEMLCLFIGRINCHPARAKSTISKAELEKEGNPSGVSIAVCRCSAKMAGKGAKPASKNFPVLPYSSRLPQET